MFTKSIGGNMEEIVGLLSVCLGCMLGALVVFGIIYVINPDGVHEEFRKCNVDGIC